MDFLTCLWWSAWASDSLDLFCRESPSLQAVRYQDSRTQRFWHQGPTRYSGMNQYLLHSLFCKHWIALGRTWFCCPFREHPFLGLGLRMARSAHGGWLTLVKIIRFLLLSLLWLNIYAHMSIVAEVFSFICLPRKFVFLPNLTWISMRRYEIMVFWENTMLAWKVQGLVMKREMLFLEQEDVLNHSAF